MTAFCRVVAQCLICFCTPHYVDDWSVDVARTAQSLFTALSAVSGGGDGVSTAHPITPVPLEPTASHAQAALGSVRVRSAFDRRAMLKEVQVLPTTSNDTVCMRVPQPHAKLWDGLPEELGCVSSLCCTPVKHMMY